MTIIHDYAGKAMGDTNNPIYVQMPIANALYVAPKIVQNTETVANLAAAAAFTGPARDSGTTPMYTNFRVRVFSDQPVTLDIYAGTNATLTSNRIQKTVAIPANTMTIVDELIIGRYIGVKVTNTGAATQTAFEVLSAFVS